MVLLVFMSLFCLDLLVIFFVVVYKSNFLLLQRKQIYDIIFAFEMRQQKTNRTSGKILNHVKIVL
jgi:hypothetical protein